MQYVLRILLLLIIIKAIIFLIVLLNYFNGLIVIGIKFQWEMRIFWGKK